MNQTKTITEWPSEQTKPGGGPDQGEFGQIEANGAGAGALANYNIQSKVFHRWVKRFFNGFG